MSPILSTSQILYDTASLGIRYDHQNEWIHSQWHGHQDDAAVRAGCAKLLEAAHRTGSKKLYNDSSEAFGEWYDAAEWIGQDFLGQLHAAGIRHIAWINAMDWPTRSCVATSIHSLTPGLVTIFEFDQAQAAQDWLRAAT